jgi:hypothetical protein
MRMENQVIDLRLRGHSTGYLEEQRSSMTRPLIVVEGTRLSYYKSWKTAPIRVALRSDQLQAVRVRICQLD